ncbi:sodium ion-translocating decarboxylase subunit beta [Sedimentibacter sp. zth1]|uniref:sodium ion-translocating decarboxylase subunit beta n=1 Tax=Sedimentibacter sp. zth1 TaxID=2816908 RepID=UPI001A92D838|nr:sodium ion-translocating decarboxylase subunit beta [Sedimentibacter sp. zth1]QSX06944.1 sodium ion-translocating decarboxylase subunit beta [Sedimentibacter sp. zth1]
MSEILEILKQFWVGTGLSQLFQLDTELFGIMLPGELIMIGIACVFLYLAIKKGYEPYLLIPIAFGMLLVNFPFADLMVKPEGTQNGGLLYYLYQGTNLGIYPPLIFLCIGAGTDFGPLIANPRSLLLGAAAQFGIFTTFIGAIALGFTGYEAASIGIIGGADGPTALYLTSQLAPKLLGPIAIAAYSYMALVPIIQPPIMKALTTEKERKIKMEQLRVVSKTEKILFPIIVTIFVVLLLPSAAALIGMLMLGNLLKESGVVPKLVDCIQNSLMYIVSILLGLTVGAKASAEMFLRAETLEIILLGLIAFSIGTASGVLLGKLMCKLSHGKINPLIGAAGVSAVPMAARVVQKEGQRYNPANFLLMHAMGPNVAGVIGSAVAAGIMLMFFS